MPGDSMELWQLFRLIQAAHDIAQQAAPSGLFQAALRLSCNIQQAAIQIIEIEKFDIEEGRLIFKKTWVSEAPSRRAAS